MAKSSKLVVMISSRCNDRFPTGAGGQSLSDIRRELKKEIVALDLAGQPSFEVWINEETDPQGGSWSSWEVCMNAVRDCDILVAVSNGNAGWASGGGEIGICHAELMTGMSVAPAKVRVIALDHIPITKDAAGQRNQRFQDYLAQQSLFRGGAVATAAELKQRVKDAIRDAVIKFVQGGVVEAGRGANSLGEALDWARLDFHARQAKMVRVLRHALAARDGSFEKSGKLFVKLDGREILAETHAIPAAMSVGPARELVGQPFLHDHLLDPFLTGKRGGPLHLIACHRGATESQAAKLLGFPDATLVTAEFGVFVADPIQKVQFAFIVNCRDEASTRHGLQRLMEWLSQTGEDRLLADRAEARARIVHAIARESKP